MCGRYGTWNMIITLTSISGLVHAGHEQVIPLLSPHCVHCWFALLASDPPTMIFQLLANCVVNMHSGCWFLFFSIILSRQSKKET